MVVPIFHVNTFCVTGYDGNPAAVCLLTGGEDNPRWMQTIACQMNLSETAFVRQLNQEHFAIRWFSPLKEIPLCGHATLASAHVLFSQKLVRGDRIEFSANGIMLTALQVDSGIELNFPPILCETAPAPRWFAPAFSVKPVEFLRGPGKYLAVLSSAEAVRKLSPDFDLLRTVADRGVIVSSRAGYGAYDIVSRYFAAYVGVDEVPVTGSAHCALGPYWGPRLSKTNLRAYQASPRGGQLLVRTEEHRVFLTGIAQIVLQGNLLI